MIKQIFSIKKDNDATLIKILGIKIKLTNYKKKYENLNHKLNNFVIEFTKDLDKIKHRTYSTAYDFDNGLIGLYLKTNSLLSVDKFDPQKLFSKRIRPLNIEYLSSSTGYIDFLFPNREGSFDNKKPIEKNPNFFYMGGIYPSAEHSRIIAEAFKRNEKIYIIEDCFLRSIFSHVYDVESEYKKSIGYTIDDRTHYIDSSIASRLELMLNDPKLIITVEQKQRARNCINKIIETHLSKYNNQPIFKPNIGRKDTKKILVVDQSFGDWSISKGASSEETFQKMLTCAIKENPDADIIVKTHPDTLSGKRSGYFSELKQHNNIYPYVEPINPISLIKYVDQVYVCTTQLGFEALMCNKKVRVFGLPFYAGWGLTIDEQKLERRTNKRSLEEIFYIAYIMYSHYINPETQAQCEIEDAIEYLLKLREKYFNATERKVCK